MKDRRVIVIVSGGIAAYKAVDLVSRLRRAGAQVRVAMTESAAQFVTPLTFEAIAGYPVYRDVFEQPKSWEIEHVSWAKWAEAIVVAPATANLIAKMAHGLADDAASTLLLAFEGPVWIAPAMNTAMWRHAATRRNVATVFGRGVHVIDPGEGKLACGDTGPGRMAEPEEILNRLAGELPVADQLVHDPEGGEEDEDAQVVPIDEEPAPGAGPLAGKTVMVTTGPTREMLDPIRFISNASTGRMGLEIALEARRRGAHVILIHGPITLAIPHDIEAIAIGGARDLLEAVRGAWNRVDIAVFAAAVANYEAAEAAEGKIKGGETLEMTLKRTPDVAAWAGAHRREGQTLIGFCAESENLMGAAAKKLKHKGLDLICANPIGEAGVGFAAADNLITLLDADGRQTPLPRASKAQLAAAIWDRALGIEA